MNQVSKITILQMIMILSLTIGLANHVTVMPLLLQTANKDAWIGVIIAFFILLLWILILYFIISKSQQKNIVQWLQAHYGKGLAGIFIFIFSIYLWFNATITLKEATMWLHTSYLPYTPQIVIAFTLISVCFYSATKGIMSIAITSGILLPIVSMLGFFVAFSNIPFKRYSFILPVFTNSMDSIIKCIIYASGGLIELIIIILLQHQLKKSIKIVHLVIMLSILVILILGPLLGSLAVFGLQAVKLQYPAYELWRLVTIGKYIEHLDFLSMFQWLSGAFTRISLAIYLICNLLNVSVRKSRLWMMGFICCLLITVVILPISDKRLIDFICYYYQSSFAIMMVVTIFLSILVLKNAQKGSKSHELLP